MQSPMVDVGSPFPALPPLGGSVPVHEAWPGAGGGTLQPWDEAPLSPMVVPTPTSPTWSAAMATDPMTASYPPPTSGALGGFTSPSGMASPYQNWQASTLQKGEGAQFYGPEQSGTPQEMLDPRALWERVKAERA
eukprot:RCo038880